MLRLLLDLPAQLETARLIVRPYRAGDGPAYYAAALNNREHLLPFERDNSALGITSVEDAEVLMRQFAADWAARDMFVLGAWVKPGEEFAAQIYIAPVTWELPEFEFGYWADKDHEGRGYVTEAARAALAFVFDDLGAQRVRLECNELNLRSQRVAERCGFTREGHLRHTRRHLLLPDGTYSGDYIYGLLREEFRR